MQYLLIPILAYGALLLGMYLFQRRLIYFPDRDLKSPEHYGFDEAKIVDIKTEDGETLHGWFAEGDADKPTVIYFHGNAGHIGARAERLKTLAQAGYPVLAVSWRGYGTSTGSPSERGLMLDSEAAVLYVMGKGIAPEDIIVFGESLGTGLAVHVGAKHKLRLVMLVAPYTSVRKRAQEMYPWLPVHWLIEDEFDSLTRAKKMQSPLLILHGEKDEIIPIHHAKELFEMVTTPKRMVSFPEVSHSDFPMERVLKEMELGVIPLLVGLASASTV